MPESNTRHIPITRPSVGEEEWLALREPITNGWLTQGPKVAEFERAFAQRHDVRHAIATTISTTALPLALPAFNGMCDDDRQYVIEELLTLDA